MSPRSAVLVLAGLLFAAGLLLGNTQHSVPNPVGDPISCGSAFVPTLDAAGADIGSAAAGVATTFQAQCASALTTPRIFASVLAGVGVLAGLYLGLTGLQRGSKTRTATARAAAHDEERPALP